MSLALLGTASSGRRRVILIAGEGPGVVCGWRRLGRAVSLGLLGTASSGWRCVIRIGGHCVVWVALCHLDCWQGVVWVAPCHWDCWAGRRLGGAV